MNTLIGHEARWAALARAFAKGEIPQTILLSGPPHIGKWTLAQQYAQLLLCPNPIEENGLPLPCKSCRVCHQVEIETFPDFKVYRPLVSGGDDERERVIAPKQLNSSIIPVSVARDFVAEAMRKPLAGPRKIMMVVQADRMLEAAQNALLKTFEEPVAGLSIFLLCDNADELKATIRSRCWHVPLGLSSDAQIAAWLGGSTPSTGAQVKAAVLAANGRPGLAKLEIERLQNISQNDAENEGESRIPRFTQAEQIVARLSKSRAVGALALTEEALRLAKIWWDEDQSGQAKANKKGDAKIARSSVARFLDELSNVYRARWAQSVRNRALDAARWSDGLDQIRKTRHYILHNANTNLALDVLFGRLIAAAATGT